MLLRWTSQHNGFFHVVIVIVLRRFHFFGSNWGDFLWEHLDSKIMRTKYTVVLQHISWSYLFVVFRSWIIRKRHERVVVQNHRSSIPQVHVWPRSCNPKETQNADPTNICPTIFLRTNKQIMKETATGCAHSPLFGCISSVQGSKTSIWQV